jgi:thiamine-phosphate pyrophosphorylase
MLPLQLVLWFTILLLRYFITDRRLCGGLGPLLTVIRRQIGNGVEYIQIREKDLSAREVWEFTRAVVEARGTAASKILVNERSDIALASGADGVHLPSQAPRETLTGLLVARSCHTEEDVHRAAADFVTFSPIFESPGKGKPVGLDELRRVCKMGVPVFALGGITRDNAPECIAAGAAGVAGIRLFME